MKSKLDDLTEYFEFELTLGLVLAFKRAGVEDINETMLSGAGIELMHLYEYFGSSADADSYMDEAVDTYLDKSQTTFDKLLKLFGISK